MLSNFRHGSKLCLTEPVPYLVFNHSAIRGYLPTLASTNIQGFCLNMLHHESRISLTTESEVRTCFTYSLYY